MKCQLCNQDDSILFLDLGNQPLANKYPMEKDFETEDFFPLQVFFCQRCKNVQLGTTISRERMFEDYYYLSSVNPGLVRHFNGLAKKIAPARFVVDIGSNDGILLKPLKQLGIRAIGVDPSINVSKIANDQGFLTLTSFFNSEAAEKIKKDFGKPDVVVASSIFTHVEDPHQFVEDVKKVMVDDGVFIPDVEKIEPHGGSLRVVARKNGLDSFSSDAVRFFLKEEENTLNLSRLEEFKHTVDAYLSAFRDKLKEYKEVGLKVAGYSAPARVSTICNYGGIGPSLIEFIVDDSPLKQNRHSPGTHIPIVSRSYLGGHKPDVLVVFAYEYLEDIKKKTNGGYRYLMPIPPKEV